MTFQAGLHALGNICGVERSADSVLLNDNAEEYLKRMIYATAAETPKLTPSVSVPIVILSYLG